MSKAADLSGMIEALPNGTVGMFIDVLASKLIQYDERQSKKPGYNHYALGHYLGAKDAVQGDVAGLESSEDPESLAQLKDSLLHRFTPGFPPSKNVIKQIDAFLSGGKLPSLKG